MVTYDSVQYDDDDDDDDDDNDDDELNKLTQPEISTPLLCNYQAYN